MRKHQETSVRSVLNRDIESGCKGKQYEPSNAWVETGRLRIGASIHEAEGFGLACVRREPVSSIGRRDRPEPQLFGEIRDRRVNRLLE